MIKEIERNPAIAKMANFKMYFFIRIKFKFEVVKPDSRCDVKYNFMGLINSVYMDRRMVGTFCTQ